MKWVMPLVPEKKPYNCTANTGNENHPESNITAVKNNKIYNVRKKRLQWKNQAKIKQNKKKRHPLKIVHRNE